MSADGKNSRRNISKETILDPSLELFEMLANGPKHPEDESDYFQRYLAREEFQQVILNEMGKKDVDVIVYPTTSIPTQVERN